MKKYLIILLMAMLPTLALAQQAGQHITRPNKPSTTNTKPPKKQAPSKKQTTPKPPKKQSHSQPVGTGHAQSDNSNTNGRAQFESRPAMQNKTFTVNGVSFTMVKIDSGTFTMGNTPEQDGSFLFDIPPHQVTLSSYYIGETEVTQELWEAVMGNNPSQYKGPLLPVGQVNCTDCEAFIIKLNKLTGEQFHIPTEAQWEFAARGGNKSKGYKYSGNNLLGEVAWYENNSSKTPHNVATRQPNELGIYDMSGNVAEWCSDWYDPKNVDESTDPKTDPTGLSYGTVRITRGGNFYMFGEQECLVSDREISAPDFRASFLGLRLAL